MMEQFFPRTPQTKENFFKSHIYFVTFILSLVLSAISYSNVSPINKDGALYLEAAQAFIESGFHASQALYGWSFYSVLIAALSQILHLSLLTTVFIINTLLLSLACVSFVAVIKRLGGNTTTLVLAVFTILCYWFFNTSRNDVLRDYGYWCFYLSAIYFLLKFCDKPTWCSAIVWNLSILLAVFFRPEGIVFLVVPLILLFNQNWACKEKIYYSLKINSLLFLTLIGFIVFLLYSLIQPHYFKLLFNFATNHLKNFIELIIENFISHKNIMADSVLNSYSARHASEVLIVIILTLVAITFFNTLGPLYFLLSLVGLATHSFPKNPNAKRIFSIFLLINFAMLITFVSAYYFLSKRYAAPAALIAITIIPFTLEKLLRHRKIFILTLTIIFIAAVPSVVHLKNDKDDIIIAGKWIDNSTSKQTLIVTNDRRIAFYANRKMKELLDEKDLLSYLQQHKNDIPLLVLRFTNKDFALEKQVRAYLIQQPNKVIENKKERVLIYFIREKISK